MDISSSTSSAGVQADTMKKAVDTQNQQVKSLMDANQQQQQQIQQQQQQQVAAQKTGVGNGLNLLA